MNNNITLYDFIIDEMLRMGLNKNQFCKKAGITYPTIARLKERQPSYKTLVKIANALGNPEYAVKMRKLPIKSNENS